MILIGAAFLSSGLMIHNDVTDLKSDQVNRPHKPLPRDIIKTRTTSATGIILMILSIIIAFTINIRDTGILNWRCGFLSIVIMLIGLYYNHYGKSHGILGNIAVALGVGAIPFWGGYVCFSNTTFYYVASSFCDFCTRDR
jgi:4-hydroxybenzoate polyprenyltransferase